MILFLRETNIYLIFGYIVKKKHYFQIYRTIDNVSRIYLVLALRMYLS